MFGWCIYDYATGRAKVENYFKLFSKGANGHRLHRSQGLASEVGKKEEETREVSPFPPEGGRPKPEEAVSPPWLPPVR